MTDLVAHQQTLRVDRFADGAEFRDFMKANYGPTIAVYRFIADDPAKVEALDADLAALGDRFLDDGVMGWEYLLVTARSGLTPRSPALGTRAGLAIHRISNHLSEQGHNHAHPALHRFPPRLLRAQPPRRRALRRLGRDQGKPIAGAPFSASRPCCQGDASTAGDRRLVPETRDGHDCLEPPQPSLAAASCWPACCSAPS